jgi:hypothetical protein
MLPSSLESNVKPSKKSAKFRQQEFVFCRVLITSIVSTYFLAVTDMYLFYYSLEWVYKLSVRHFNNKIPPQRTAFCRMNLFLNAKPNFLMVAFSCYRIYFTATGFSYKNATRLWTEYANAINKFITGKKF